MLGFWGTREGEAAFIPMDEVLANMHLDQEPDHDEWELADDPTAA